MLLAVAQDCPQAPHIYGSNQANGFFLPQPMEVQCSSPGMFLPFAVKDLFL